MNARPLSRTEWIGTSDRSNDFGRTNRSDVSELINDREKNSNDPAASLRLFRKDFSSRAGTTSTFLSNERASYRQLNEKKKQTVENNAPNWIGGYERYIRRSSHSTAIQWPHQVVI